MVARVSQRDVWRSHRLFHLNLVDFDAEEFVFEVAVEVEAISVLHVFPSWNFIEYASFPAGQRLKRALELFIL